MKSPIDSVLIIFFLVFAEGKVSKNRFNGLVYTKLKPKNNFIMSPISLQTLLQLTQQGSRGATAAELQQHLNSSNLDAFRTSLHSNSINYTLRAANKIFVQSGFPIKNDFKTTARNDFHADCQNLDFTNQEEAAGTINDWVSNQKIENLIEPSTINPETKLLFVNTLYFQANWSKPFLIFYTQYRDFHLSPRNTTKVKTMLLYEEYFNYYRASKSGTQFLELPFKGGKASMVIVLPLKIGLRSIERHVWRLLQPPRWKKRFLNVALPKFRIDAEINFRRALQRMGVRHIFRASADLSGISGNKGDLVVDQIVQKAHIDVSEEGVEAAAATYKVDVVPISVPIERPKKFIVDRPFIFYIKVHDVVVFVGRVRRPDLPVNNI